MLPILVLIFATSALAAPEGIRIHPVNDNDIPSRDNSIVALALNVINGGDVNFNILTAQETIKDMSRSRGSQAQALGQAIALLGELATGRPGDACAAANLINAYAHYVSSGNAGGVRNALRGYVQSLASNIDSLARLVSNPESVRYATGSRGGCSGEGRTYQFEAAWESIIGSASPNQISIINEEYCTARRLYSAFSARSNNVGAQLTASALPPTTQVFQGARAALSQFVNSLGSNSNVGQAASAVKQALLNAVSHVNL